MNKPATTLNATMYLGRLSRDRLNKDDHSWSDFLKLKEAFVARRPELKEPLKKFMEREKSKWRELFSDLFKKHSLSVFVLANVPESEYIY